MGLFTEQQNSQQGPAFPSPVAPMRCTGVFLMGPLGRGERGVSHSYPQDQWEHKTWVNPRLSRPQGPPPGAYWDLGVSSGCKDSAAVPRSSWTQRTDPELSWKAEHLMRQLSPPLWDPETLTGEKARQKELSTLQMGRQVPRMATVSLSQAEALFKVSGSLSLPHSVYLAVIPGSEKSQFFPRNLGPRTTAF